MLLMSLTVGQSITKRSEKGRSGNSFLRKEKFRAQLLLSGKRLGKCFIFLIFIIIASLKDLDHLGLF